MFASIVLAAMLGSGDGNGITAPDCQGPLQGEYRLLRSEEVIDLCELTHEKVTLVVNTASQCGFTGQFEGLEALYQTYREQGFQVVGFPSDSFRQEYGDEEQTAEVCFINYGVTFPMMATSRVRGGSANPVFAELIEKSGQAPRWNFYKYLVSREGDVLGVYPSTTRPDDQSLMRDIERAL